MPAGVVNFSSRGVEQMINRLKVLPGSPARRVVRKSTTAAGSVLRKAVRANAPKRSGALKKSIRSKSRSDFTTDSMAQVIIGPDVDYMQDGDRPSKYVHIVEFGSRFQTGSRFMTRAIEQSRRGAIARWIRKARAELQKEIAKLRIKS